MMNERQVQNLVETVANGEGVFYPRITYVDGPHSHTHDEGITISSPAWFKEHQVGTAAQYRLLVLHEMAHWIRRGEGHTARFYHELFLLCLAYGVKVSTAYEDEVKYKPRAARAGLELLVA